MVLGDLMKIQKICLEWNEYVTLPASLVKNKYQKE